MCPLSSVQTQLVGCEQSRCPRKAGIQICWAELFVRSSRSEWPEGRLGLRASPAAARRRLGQGQLTFLGPDDEGLRGPVHQAAVPVDQVGHVLGDGQRRGRDRQGLHRGEEPERAVIVPAAPQRASCAVTSD